MRLSAINGDEVNTSARNNTLIVRKVNKGEARLSGKIFNKLKSLGIEGMQGHMRGCSDAESWN